MQSIILAAFFLPYVLPVTVVYLIWDWMFNVQFGIAAVHHRRRSSGSRSTSGGALPWFLPMVALITDLVDQRLLDPALPRRPAEHLRTKSTKPPQLDGATRWQIFWRITWPLIWPVTVLCLTIQLILQLKIFDQVYLFSMGGRTQATMVLVQYIFDQAFVHNKGGYAATIAVALFVIVIAFSVLQFQALRARRCSNERGDRRGRTPSARRRAAAFATSARSS